MVQWPYMVIPPRVGHAAYRALSKNDQIDGFDTMSAVLNVLHALRDANGEGATNNKYYAPLIMADRLGNYQPPGGGLGGGNVATGTPSYTGVFIHEMGHAFGLPHQGAAFSSGKYPYIGGSLLGSAWGYDQIKNEFLGPFVPSTSTHYVTCLSATAFVRQTDAQGRCVKQDPMQSGGGDQAAGYIFGTFSDYSTAQMQGDLRQKIYPDPNSATGYSEWDPVNRVRVDASTATTQKGLYGLDRTLPNVTGVPVHAIIVTYSNTPCTTPGIGACNAASVDTSVSQIYPPISYVGNLRRTIDPTRPADLASIVPNTSANPWYCSASGCDYTLRVTYADGTQYHAVLQYGFRSWFRPTGALPATATDPLKSSSYKTWGVNVPGNKAIARIELLRTPMVWNGMPLNPMVLISR